MELIIQLAYRGVSRPPWSVFFLLEGLKLNMAEAGEDVVGEGDDEELVGWEKEVLVVMKSCLDVEFPPLTLRRNLVNMAGKKPEDW